MAKEEFDIFNIQKTFPKADRIFGTKIESIESILNDCIFIIDTNALLLPYLTGSDSLTEIGHIYEKLKGSNQLRIPDQVAREFANNRPKKLGEIFQAVNKKRNGLPEVSIGRFPLLEGLDSYKNCLQIEKEIKELFKKYHTELGSIASTIRNWAWDDPVSELYAKLFTADLIIEITESEEKVKEDLAYRYLHKVPPGYKDGGKQDDGVGDLLIWYAILEIAQMKKHVIFVSGDEKADWFYKSEKEALYPRFELLYEFQTKSDPKSVHIIRLSSLLKLFGADKSVVVEVAREEMASITVNKKSIPLITEQAVYVWFKKAFPKAEISRLTGRDADLEIVYEDGNSEAIEIVSLSSNLSNTKLQIRSRLQKALGINTSVYTKLYFVIVVGEEVETIDHIVTMVDQLVYKENVSAIDIEIIYGFLDNGFNFNTIVN